MRRYRNSLDWSQAKLGEKIGEYLGDAWSRQAVWNAERGNRAFGVSDLVALTKVFDLPLSAFFLDVPEPYEVPRPSLAEASSGRDTFVTV